jgi:hypothetical protein
MALCYSDGNWFNDWFTDWNVCTSKSAVAIGEVIIDHDHVSFDWTGILSVSSCISALNKHKK